MSYDEDGNGRGVAIALTRDWAHWHRPMATRLPGWRSAALLCGLLVLGLSLAGLAHAQTVAVQNALVSKSLPGDTGNGSSSPAALSSADGRYVLFSSLGSNFVPGIADFNNATDVFLHDRTTQVTVLVSRSAASAMTTANAGSTATAISPDGEWVLFQSSATNLVSGITDSNGSVEDVFLYQRSTGAVSLVSRSAASATTANGRSVPTAISADGEWVLFYSAATNLVPAVTDINGASEDVFLYQRSTGAMRLVSRSAASATTTANSRSFASAISADGEWVLLESSSTNLVSGVTYTNSGHVFLYQRSTGAVSLVSRSAASATTAANSQSFASAISADGEWVLFGSLATNLVSGLTDGNLSNDVFLYQRSTGAMSLVSRSAASATTAASSLSFASAISADGEWVLFRSLATNLVSGVTDSNLSDDVFLYQRSTGAVTLISRSSASATTTANRESVPTAITADGEWVLFQSRATNLVSGLTDVNGIFGVDAFLYQRSTGAVSLISRSAASATTTANTSSIPTAISADGEHVLFGSVASDLASGVTDDDGFEDVFLYQRSMGTVSLISRPAGSAPTTPTRQAFPTAISANGEWVLFQSAATRFVPGVTDSNRTSDAFLYQRSTGAVSLVSRSAASATTTANGESFPRAMSADGEWVLFVSNSSNLVSGVTDSNGRQDVFLYQRSTGTVSLVSRSAASATTTANESSSPTAISADGEWVLFSSGATNLVSGFTDNNGFISSDVFLYQRSTGVVSLVSRSAAAAATTGNQYSLPVAISADGEWVLFESEATDLASGITDSNQSLDAFLYQRSTGAVSLVSRSAASATTANGFSSPAAISADGEWVLFHSLATNLVSGLADGNFSFDVFLYQSSTGAVRLVSRSAESATTMANNFSVSTSISADGEWVLFQSQATNLVPGVTDSNGGLLDVFLYQRSTGAVSLVSRSVASAMTTANVTSEPTAISADGEWVLFQSLATDLVSGVSDRNGTWDAFLYQRSTGATSLISRSVTSASTGNNPSIPTAISADGKCVLFRSTAADLVAGVLDNNGLEDAFLAQMVPDRVFIDGFEPTQTAVSVQMGGR